LAFIFFLAKRQKKEAVQIFFVKKLQTKLKETYNTKSKCKNEILSVPTWSFVFIGLLRRRFFRTEG